jgi:hypothetical protein
VIKSVSEGALVADAVVDERHAMKVVNVAISPWAKFTTRSAVEITIA